MVYEFHAANQAKFISNRYLHCFKTADTTGITVLCDVMCGGVWCCTGLGPKAYFVDPSNSFDAVIVVLSFVDIGIGMENEPLVSNGVNNHHSHIQLGQTVAMS